MYKFSVKLKQIIITTKKYWWQYIVIDFYHVSLISITPASIVAKISNCTLSICGLKDKLMVH